MSKQKIIIEREGIDWISEKDIECLMCKSTYVNFWSYHSFPDNDNLSNNKFKMLCRDCNGVFSVTKGLFKNKREIVNIGDSWISEESQKCPHCNAKGLIIHRNHITGVEFDNSKIKYKAIMRCVYCNCKWSVSQKR